MDYNDEALIRRIHREVADYYDEELELEARGPGPRTGTEPAGTRIGWPRRQLGRLRQRGRAR